MIVIYILGGFLMLGSTISYEGVFWHVCDIHLNLSYNSTVSDPYGDYIMDSSYPLVLSTLQQMKKLYFNPEFIIWNGDNVYHGPNNFENFLLSLQNVTSEILKHFPNSNILPSLGNHDVNPSSLLDIKLKWCEKLFEKWNFFFNNSSEIESFKKGCYYSREIQSKNSTLTIIVLNTMLWYRPNKLVAGLTDPLDQFEWLTNELRKSKQNKIKVFIVAHIPPGASEASPQKYRFLHPNFNERFVNIMQMFSDTIEAGFFAHQHVDAFKIIFNSEHNPVIPLFISPSVSPYYLRGLGSVNPSIRLFRWNKSSEYSEYSQFHTLLPINTNLPLNWSLEYNSTSLLSGLSAFHLYNFSLDLSRPDSKYFDKFFQYHLSGRLHDYPYCIANSTCRCKIICGIHNVDYVKLDVCLSKCQRFLGYQWWTLGSIIIIISSSLIVLAMLSIIAYYRKRRNSNSPRRFHVEKLYFAN